MLPKDQLENRHAPPGVNSRSMTAAQSAAELEIHAQILKGLLEEISYKDKLAVVHVLKGSPFVLRDIEHVYFAPPHEFDAARHALTQAPSPPTCEAIAAMFDKLKRQQQVVSGKALHLISQQRDKCDKEFNEIQNIRQQLSQTLDTCREAREHLHTASNNLTVSTFVILANFRKRQIIKTVLKSLELLKQLRSVEKDVTELLNKKEYVDAIDLILNSLKAAHAHREFTCIADLTSRLKDTLEITEEKLDTVMASLCYEFDEDVFEKLRTAYGLLGKTQVAMDGLHMHYSSAVNESAVEAIRPYITDPSADVKFQQLCQMVPLNKSTVCLLSLCEKLFLVMRSYYLLVNWHSRHEDESAGSNNAFDIERNVSREYIKQKLKAGLVRIWHDVQAKISTFLKGTVLEEFPFEKFIQILGILRKLTQVAEIFCGDTSDLLQDFIKMQSVAYIKNYHRGRMEELKLFLENEGWEQCPVKSNFTLLSLQEFKQFKKYITGGKSDISILQSQSQSDATSSVHSQDDSVYVKKYFNANSSHTPFDMFRDENVTNDDIFGLEPDAAVSEDSEDEPEELRRDYVDDADHTELTPHRSNHTSPWKTKETVIVTNTTLSVLRNCGQYLQICRYLPQISLEVVMLMNQLFDYYFYAVHLFFTSDLDVASNTLYTPKLTTILRRISNNIDIGAGDCVGKTFPSPELPKHLDLASEDTLHGLTERIIAVESVIFLAKQFQLLQPYLESIVAQHQKMILEHFDENTLAVAADLRMPVYMCPASKAIDGRSCLIAMSQVRWEVKDIAEAHSPYVDMILRRVQFYALRLENIAARVTLNSEVLTAVWSVVAKFVVHLLVEGFSNATKCSNGGRGLMQLDYRQLFVKLEKIAGLKPIPYQDYVDRYVKAYYLPRNELEQFVKQRGEYSNKHLLALVTCACEIKRDRQQLIAILEGKDASN